MMKSNFTSRYIMTKLSNALVAVFGNEIINCFQFSRESLRPELNEE